MMRAIVVVIACSLAGCAAAAAAPALGSVAVATAVSRASGGCFAQCVGNTECDSASGLCVPTRRRDATTSTPITTPLPETRSFPTSGGASFHCTTVDGLDDDVTAESLASAQGACEELNGEPCDCGP